VAIPVQRARVRLLHSATRARASGWRCVCRFEGITFADGTELVGVEVRWEGRDSLVPGDVSECTLHFWAPEMLHQSLEAGTPCWLQEGAKVVAAGALLANEDLEEV
jgi:hypothetical protein